MCASSAVCKRTSFRPRPCARRYSGHAYRSQVYQLGGTKLDIAAQPRDWPDWILRETLELSLRCINAVRTHSNSLIPVRSGENGRFRKLAVPSRQYLLDRIIVCDELSFRRPASLERAVAVQYSNIRSPATNELHSPSSNVEAVE